MRGKAIITVCLWASVSFGGWWAWNVPRGGEVGFDSYTKACWHFDEANLSTNCIDATANGHGLVFYGDSHTYTGQYKFATASVVINGGAGGALDYGFTANSSDWDFGTGDFTIDFWAYRVGGGAYGGFVSTVKNTSPSGLAIGLGVNATEVRVVWGNAQRLLTAAIPSLTWNHIALVRYGNSVTVYTNGASAATYNATGQSINSDGQGLVVGRLVVDYNGYYYLGYIDELRISKGIARWTTNFTPPTAPYP
jgi:hypothetical protein